MSQQVLWEGPRDRRPTDQKSNFTNAKSQRQTRALWETGPRAPRAGQSFEVPGHKETGARRHVASRTGVEVQSLCSFLILSSPLSS